MPVIRMPTDDEYEKIFEPYAIELGKLVHAWNQLHEELGSLFWAVSEIKNGEVAFGIWYSTNSDRAQQEMLRAASSARVWPRPRDNDAIRSDIQWILGRADTLSDQRNDAIHSPYLMSTGASGTVVKPRVLSRNPRARKLGWKDLLKEFGWYRESADTLSAFAAQMHFHLDFPQVQKTWPKRPTMPLLGQLHARVPSSKTAEGPAGSPGEEG